VTTDRWERWAALSGLAVAIVFVAALALSGVVPEAPAPGATIADFFAEHRTTLLAAEYLVGLASVLMVWFWGTLRSALARAEGGTGRLAAVALSAGTAQALAYALSAGIWGTIAYGAPRADGVAVAYRIGYVAFQAGAFLFSASMLATGLSAIRSGSLPAWLSWTTVVIGAAALAIRAFPEETYGAEDVGRVLFLFVPLWFAVAGVVLWQRGGSGGP
jgi:hypothetical protein